ncbi:MAG: hypothetical protein PVJ02_15660 [Gemmatimonadota bacterium]|jgi:hypothetical protein
MLDDREKDILTIAMYSAEERKGVARLMSYMGTKMHKWKKPGNVVKTVASGAGAAIPIPGVSIATDYIVNKVADKARTSSHKKKQRKYNQLADQDPDDPTIRLKQMKFDVKNLDAKHLDESLRKVRKQLQMYGNPGPGLSPCHAAFQTAYRYFRSLYRLERLYYEAAGMVALGEEIMRYCDEQEERIDGEWDQMLNRLEGLLNHDPATCKAGSGCYNGPNGEQRLRRDADKMRAAHDD